jgi:hypothetical protein
MASQADTRRSRAERALADPIFFGELYMRPYTEGWETQLPPFAKDMLAFALAHTRGVVQLPPEFLKTTCISQLLPLWLTYRYSWAKKVLRGLLLSEEEGIAQANLAVISWHIENNELLRADFHDARGRALVFPDPKEEIWRQDAITVARPGTSKDPTWQAKGLDSSGIHGRRIDWLLGDDVVTPKNAFSPAKRRAALRTWDLEISTRLVADGRAILAGNLNHDHDLTATLAKRKSYRLFKRPAIHEQGKPTQGVEADHPRATLLWPENWPWERLRREAEDKPSTFRVIYLLDPSAEYGEKLQIGWLDVVSDDQVDLDSSAFIIAVDPAPGGEQADLDFFNITVLAIAEPQIVLYASIDVRRSTPEQLALVKAVHDRFQRIGRGVVWIAAAKVTVDHYLRGALVTVHPDLAHKIVGVSAPGSKRARLEALGPLAKVGAFRVHEAVYDELTSDAADQFQELSFKEQWRTFPGRHDDKLDGLDLALRCYREHGTARVVEFELEVA